MSHARLCKCHKIVHISKQRRASCLLQLAWFGWRGAPAARGVKCSRKCGLKCSGEDIGMQLEEVKIADAAKRGAETNAQWAGKKKNFMM